MHTFLFFILGFGYTGLLIWGIVLVKRVGILHVSNILLLVIFGLAYDNLIIAIGKFLGEGHLLETLSYIRFWLHTLFTPTLILFAWSVYRDTSSEQAKAIIWEVLTYFLTIGLIIYEFITTIIGLDLKANWQNGMLTYENVDQSMGPIMVIIVTLILGIVGYVLMRKERYPYLLIGTMIMMLGGAISIWLKTKGS